MPKSELRPMTAEELAGTARDGRQAAVDGKTAAEDVAALLIHGAILDGAASIVAALDRHTRETRRLRQAVEAVGSAVRQR